MTRAVARDGSGPVGVVGLGLIGGSLARTLVAAGVPVVATDPDPETRAAASAEGVDVRDDVAGVCAAAPGVLVLASPLAVLGEVLAQVADAGLREGTVLTDVGSVKADVRSRVVGHGLGDRYVGAHPMAGTELSGFAASSADLLPGARWAVTVGTAPAADAAAVLRLVTGPLRGSAYVVDDAAHDDAVALVSHVPHVVATELLNLVADSDARALALGLAAGSFRDGTRVARTDPARTQAMIEGNARAVVRALRASADHLAALADALEGAGDPYAADDAVTAFFTRADDVRADLERGGPPVASPSRTVRLDERGWREVLAAAGADGWRVVGVDGATVHLAR